MTSESATAIQVDDGRAPAVTAAAPAAGEAAAAAASSSYATAPTSSSAAAAEPAAAAAVAPRKTTTTGAGGRLPFLLRSGGAGRCLAVIDLLLRVGAFGATLAAAISTGTADETLSVFTNSFQFRARFHDFPALTLFLVANAVAAGYLLLSLPLSAVAVLRGRNVAAGVRLLLLLACDVVIMALLTAAGAAAAAIVYVAHEGNRRANWPPFCMQFHGFCQRTSGSVVATFLAVVVFIVLILMAAFAIRRTTSRPSRPAS